MALNAISFLVDRVCWCLLQRIVTVQKELNILQINAFLLMKEVTRVQ